jgi:hypothetical protein
VGNLDHSSLESTKPIFYSALSVRQPQSPYSTHYNIATPANNPPAIAPTTPATFAPAAPVLCAATDALDVRVTDELRAALVDIDDARDTVALLEAIVAFDDIDTATDPETEESIDCIDCDAAPDDTADDTRERMNVGV